MRRSPPGTATSADDQEPRGGPRVTLDQRHRRAAAPDEHLLTLLDGICQGDERASREFYQATGDRLLTRLIPRVDAVHCDNLLVNT